MVNIREWLIGKEGCPRSCLELYETDLSEQESSCQKDIVSEIFKREVGARGDWVYVSDRMDFGHEYYLAYIDINLVPKEDRDSARRFIWNVNGNIDLYCFIIRKDDDNDFIVDPDVDECSYNRSCSGMLEGMYYDLGCYYTYSLSSAMLTNATRIYEIPSDFSFDTNYKDRLIAHGITTSILGGNKEDDCNIDNNFNNNDNKGDDKIMNIFGMNCGAVENGYGIQMDKDGNLGIDGRFLDEGDVLAELGSVVDDECIKLVIIPTELSKIKPGDIFLDGDQALIVRTADIKTGSIDYYKGENAMRKVMQKHPMLRKIMVSKLDNLYSMFENVSDLLPLMTYGEEKVVNLITQQIISGKEIDLTEIEYQLNPTKAQTDLTKSLTAFVETVKNLNK